MQQLCSNLCNICATSLGNSCVCRASQLKITTAIHPNALNLGSHWEISFNSLLQDAVESQAGMPHLYEPRNRGNKIALIGARDASRFSKRFTDASSLIAELNASKAHGSSNDLLAKISRVAIAQLGSNKQVASPSTAGSCNRRRARGLSPEQSSSGRHTVGLPSALHAQLSEQGPHLPAPVQTCFRS